LVFIIHNQDLFRHFYHDSILVRGYEFLVNNPCRFCDETPQ
jgi:hypothetical protein